MYRNLLMVVLAMAQAACTQPIEQMEPTRATSMRQITGEQWQALSRRTIYFGHQSVGRDILDGILDIAAQNSEVRLNIANGIQSSKGPALIEFAIGENGDPASKIRDFGGVIASSTPKPDAVLMFKFCYVDVKRDTDIEGLFQQYRTAVTSLRATYPNYTIVHVTMPLTTVESTPEYALRRILGRYSRRDLNVKRNQYNDMLRGEYAGKDVIFDLAVAESTRSDGSRSYFSFNGTHIYMLAPEWTSDGGHLNEAGRRHVAEQLLVTLASLPTVKNTTAPK